MTITVLMVTPLGNRDMRAWCGGWATRKNRRAVSVPTTNDEKDPKLVAADAAGVHPMIIDALAADPAGEVVLFAHSRGCLVVGEWIAVWSRLLSDRDAARVRAVLTGNLERARTGFIARKPKWMGSGNSVRTTPENTRIRVLDIIRKGDLWGMYPGGALAWPLLFLNQQHRDYSRVNPDDLKPIRGGETVVGNTRYVTVP